MHRTIASKRLPTLQLSNGHLIQSFPGRFTYFFGNAFITRWKQVEYVLHISNIQENLTGGENSNLHKHKRIIWMTLCITGCIMICTAWILLATQSYGLARRLTEDRSTVQDGQQRWHLHFIRSSIHGKYAGHFNFITYEIFCWLWIKKIALQIFLFTFIFEIHTNVLKFKKLTRCTNIFSTTK